MRLEVAIDLNPINPKPVLHQPGPGALSPPAPSGVVDRVHVEKAVALRDFDLFWGLRVGFRIEGSFKLDLFRV